MAEKEIVPVKKEVSVVSENVASLQLAVNEEAAKREVLRTYVKDQLVDNQDYGVIPLGGNRSSKPTLFKPGMEKIYSLMKITSEVKFDKELSDFLSNATDKVVAYHCTLRNTTGEVIGDGGGSCSIKEKRGDANTAIKIAQKRARMDACLSLGFSEYFTQDLDDMQPPEHSNPSLPPQQAVAARVFSGDDPLKDLANKEVRDVVITVLHKEMKTANSGNTYAMLSTDLGPMKAWKNSMNQIEEGKTYNVAVEGSLWNGTMSHVILVINNPVLTEEEPLPELGF